MYSTNIKDSLNTTLELITDLSTLETNNANLIHKSLTLDTLKLLKTKSTFKTNFNTKNQTLINKVQKSSSSVLNPLLKKLKIQLTQNLDTQSKLNNTLTQLPNINLNVLESGDNFNSLNLSLNDIEHLLNENDYASLNISSNIISDLQRELEDSDVKKFKLIKLNDVYYQRESISLQQMDAKWSQELTNVKSFIKGQLGGFNNNLKNKIESSKQLQGENEGEEEEEVEIGEEVSTGGNVNGGVEVLIDEEEEEEEEEEREQDIEDNEEEVEEEEEEEVEEEMEEEGEKEPEEGKKEQSPPPSPSPGLGEEEIEL